MKKIFEPVKLGKLEAKNRLVRSATGEGTAGPDGNPTEATYETYRKLAEGGIGTIITGLTSVSDDDCYYDNMMRLSNDELIPKYKVITDIAHAENCPIITQLALGALFRDVDGEPTKTEQDDLTKDEIRMTIQQFIDAAVRADKAGFDGVQIHAAHFFFLSRFISPAINHRTDEYGGSTENRARIILEIMDGIRKAAPGLHITIKINSNDFMPDGMTEEECTAICRLLDKNGIDSIEVSGNNYAAEGVKANDNEGYFAPAASKIAEAVSCPVISVGGYRSVDKMEDVLNKTKIHMISISRPLIREPDLPGRMMEDRSTVPECISCNKCFRTPAHTCIFKLK